MNTSICILDIETTGFEPGDAEIVELFILKVNNEDIIDEFYSLFRPTIEITNSHIHGITDEKVKNSPSFFEKTDEIINFIQGSTLLGHNIDNFDLKFLNYFLKQELKNNTIDTSSPFWICLAIVPPTPITSSSGCAPITRTFTKLISKIDFNNTIS